MLVKTDEQPERGEVRYMRCNAPTKRREFVKAGYRPLALCGFHADEWRAEPGTLYLRRRRLGDNHLPPPRWELSDADDS